MKKCGLVSLSITLLVVTLTSVIQVDAVIDYNSNGLDCTEVCLLDATQRVADKQGEKKQLEKLITLINRLKALRIKNNINSTVITLDSSVSPVHGLEYDRAGIFTFQQQLGAFIAYTLPVWTGNPGFHTQFDGDQGWYCQSWSCQSRCASQETILYDLEDALESTTPGLIEDGCHLGRKALQHDDCSSSPWKKALLIAITNSEINNRHGKKSRSAHSSACRKYKDRVIVGTHATPWKQMKDFASTSDNAIYIEDSPENRKLLGELLDCLSLECCFGIVNPPATTQPVCLRTVSGYDVNQFRLKK